MLANPPDCGSCHIDYPMRRHADRRRRDRQRSSPGHRGMRRMHGSLRKKHPNVRR